MYKRRYSCIKQAFSYTTSHPPKYELLPATMSEIFRYYNEFRDPYDMKYTWISNEYPFPDIRGMSSDSLIKRWISSYFAILFLRQYSITPHLTSVKPLDFPRIPDTQGEIRMWIDSMDFLQKLVSEHLNNKELLAATNLDYITPDWCDENEKLFPTRYIEALKKQFIDSYEQKLKIIPISKDKVTQFEQSTKKIIEETIFSLKQVSNKMSIEGDTDKWFVKGQKMLQSKDAFSESPEVHHIDFDSFLASVLSKNIQDGVASTFFFKKTKTYLIKQEELFKAVDKLKIRTDYVIISFGINIDYYIKHLKTPKLTFDRYRDIDILKMPSSNLVYSSLYILKKSDLPNIATLQIDKGSIDKYSLIKISDSINLYTSVIDLNSTSEEIFNENRENIAEEDIRKSVLMSIIISTEIKWRKNIDVISIVEYSEYDQKGLPNNINDIKAIDQ